MCFWEVNYEKSSIYEQLGAIMSPHSILLWLIIITQYVIETYANDGECGITSMLVTLSQIIVLINHDIWIIWRPCTMVDPYAMGFEKSDATVADYMVDDLE